MEITRKNFIVNPVQITHYVDPLGNTIDTERMKSVTYVLDGEIQMFYCTEEDIERVIEETIKEIKTRITIKYE